MTNLGSWSRRGDGATSSVAPGRSGLSHGRLMMVMTYARCDPDDMARALARRGLLVPFALRQPL